MRLVPAQTVHGRESVPAAIAHDARHLPGVYGAHGTGYRHLQRRAVMPVSYEDGTERRGFWFACLLLVVVDIALMAVIVL